MTNLIGSMLSCYPMTGSISRSAVSDASGALSQFAGIATGMLMLCSLLFMTPLFYYLPKFVLAAIVIAAVSGMFRYDDAAELWKIKKRDFGLWLGAFLGTLFLGALHGIAAAVVLSVVCVMYEAARPQITFLWRIPYTSIYRNIKQESEGVLVKNVLILRPGGSMFFMNAAFIQDTILSYVEDLEDANRTEYVVLEMTSVVSVDSTAIRVLRALVQDLRGRGIKIAFAMVGNRLERTLRQSKLLDEIGSSWFFSTVHEAVTFCLEDKLQRGSVDNRDTENLQDAMPDEAVP
jgi:sulfate transporter 4